MVSRNYCCTVYDEEFNNLDKRFASGLLIRYVVWQQEKCPDSGRLHYQVYCELFKPSRFRAVQRALEAPACHCEPRRGTRDEARAYCQKEETRVEGWWEDGDWRGGSQGARGDLLAMHAALEAGDSLRSISDEHFPVWIKYTRGVVAWRLLHAERRDWPMEVWVLHGPTGTGKSLGAHTAAPNAFVLPQGNSSGGAVWWDGYDGEHTVIIDEFYGWLRLSFLLILLDRFPMSVQTKGGVVSFTSKRIIICSNKHWRDWYDFSSCPMHEAALGRRISRVIHAESAECWTF